MSAAHSLPFRSGLAGLRMTAEEYLAVGETNERTELIDGLVIMSPSPIPRHAKFIVEVVKQLEAFAERGGDADVFLETDLQINTLSVLRPDLCVYARAPGHIPDRLTESPDLVVEVLSPGSEAYDLITKKDEYERRGVKEYWVIDPRDARVRAWRRQSTRLVESLVEGRSVPSAAIPGFTLEIAPLERLSPARP